MAALSFVAMYILMYAMVDRFANVYPNVNQLYMAGLMTAPMILIELFVMQSMYMNKMLNIVIVSVSSILLIVFFLLIRYQTAVGDTQFLKSMIPHHAAAILMCNEAPVQDPDIQELCRNILSNQQSEIDQMKAKLHELNQ
jgi:hypothetical protein